MGDGPSATTRARLSPPSNRSTHRANSQGQQSQRLDRRVETFGVQQQTLVRRQSGRRRVFPLGIRGLQPRGTDVGVPSRRLREWPLAAAQFACQQAKGVSGTPGRGDSAGGGCRFARAVCLRGMGGDPAPVEGADFEEFEYAQCPGAFGAPGVEGMRWISTRALVG